MAVRTGAFGAAKVMLTCLIFTSVGQRNKALTLHDNNNNILRGIFFFC